MPCSGARVPAALQKGAAQTVPYPQKGSLFKPPRLVALGGGVLCPLQTCLEQGWWQGGCASQSLGNYPKKKKHVACCEVLLLDFP